MLTCARGRPPYPPTAALLKVTTFHPILFPTQAGAPYSKPMSTLTHTQDDIVPRIEAAGERLKRVHKAAASVIFGQDLVIERTLVTLLAGGHCLLIGVPGLAKTLLVETLGKVLGLDAKRIQFTPDLMPSDIIGSEVLEDNPASAARSASSPARSSRSC